MAEHENVLKNIITILGDSSFDASFIEMVLKRLESLTYTIQEGDDWSIAFTIGKVEMYIRNVCNVISVPDGLKYVAIDMICGNFLFDKNNTGNLGESFNVDLAVKQIQEGDSSVTFAVSDKSSPEEKFAVLCTYMMHNGEGELVCFRKLKW